MRRGKPGGVSASITTCTIRVEFLCRPVLVFTKMTLCGCERDCCSCTLYNALCPEGCKDRLNAFVTTAPVRASVNPADSRKTQLSACKSAAMY